MPNRIEVNLRDLQELLEAVDYAIQRMEATDPTLTTLLKEKQQRLLVSLEGIRTSVGVFSDVNAVLDAISPPREEDHG